MHNDRPLPDEPPVADHLAGVEPMPDPAALLAAAERLVRERARIDRELAGLWRDLHAFGGTLPVSGYTDDEWLTLVGRVSGFEARRLGQVAARLPALPACDRALFRGDISLDQAGWVLSASTRLSGDALDRFDRHACAIAQDANVRADDPDIRPALDALLRELVPERAVLRQERRAEHGQRLLMQLDLDGGGWLYGELDPVGMATVSTAIEHASGPPSPHTTRKCQRAAGLVAVCDRWNADPAHGTSRPSVSVVVDLADATTNTAGRVLTNVRTSRLQWLTARTVDTLTCDADLLVQLHEGARPLVRLKDRTRLPDTTRQAVLTADGGCRWPGCTAPVWQVDVHHLHHRGDDGDHHPDNLVSLCRDHHRRLHGPAWTADLDGRTRILRLHRGGASGPTHTTHPHGRPRAPDELADP